MSYWELHSLLLVLWLHLTLFHSVCWTHEECTCKTRAKGTSSHDLTVTILIESPGTFHHCNSSDFCSCLFLCTPALLFSEAIKAAIMDIRYPNITIWSVSSLFFIGPIFICSLSFYMKLHYCGLGCLVMNFSHVFCAILLLKWTVAIVRWILTDLLRVSFEWHYFRDILVFASIVWALWIMYRFKNKSCCWFVHFFPCTLLHLGYSLTHLI